MLRACTTLLFALTADAARNNLKVERASSIDQVMKTVSLLLQGENTDDKALGKVRALASQSWTDDVATSLDVALSSVIAELDSNVISMITKAHAEAQAAVDKTIGELDVATVVAVDQKSAANNKDNTWYDCVTAEKAQRVAIETAEANLAQSEANQVQPCLDQVAATLFSMDPQLKGFECDISQGKCDANLATYESQDVQQLLDNVENTLSAKQAIYTAAKGACDAAKADVIAKQSALQEAKSVWTSQRATCAEEHSSRRLSFCLFGENLQTKCEKAAAHQAQVALVNGAGSEFSHSDRVAEWTTTVKTKCLLQKVIIGEVLDAAASAACDQMKYESDVGVIDTHDDTFASLSTTAKFTCSETTISFRGEEWDVPQGVAPASSAYTVHDYTPEVSLIADTSPFATCAV